MFVCLEGGLRSPEDDRLHNVRIHPYCGERACFFVRFERWLEKSQKMTGCVGFGYTHVVGTLRAFLRWVRCQQRPKCSGVAQVPTSSTF